MRELADVLCVSIRTAERRTREMRKACNIERWARIPTEEAVRYFDIPRYKIERLFVNYKRFIEDD